MHLGPVQADRAQLQHTRLLGQQEHLHEQVLEFWQEGASKRGKRIVIGMQVARDKAKGYRLIGSTLNLARTEHSGRIPIEQQAQQHFRSVGFPTARPIVGIERREVKLGHAIYQEAGQMVGGQTVAQPHCQIERLVVVHRFEGSTHAYQYTIPDHLLLSDKLLGHTFFIIV